MHIQRRRSLLALVIALALGIAFLGSGHKLGARPAAAEDTPIMAACSAGAFGLDNCILTLGDAIPPGGSLTASLAAYGATMVACGGITAGISCSVSGNVATFVCPAGCSQGTLLQETVQVFAGPAPVQQFEITIPTAAVPLLQLNVQPPIGGCLFGMTTAVGCIPQSSYASYMGCLSSTIDGCIFKLGYGYWGYFYPSSGSYAFYNPLSEYYGYFFPASGSYSFYNPAFDYYGSYSPAFSPAFAGYPGTQAFSGSFGPSSNPTSPIFFVGQPLYNPSTASAVQWVASGGLFAPSMQSVPAVQYVRYDPAYLATNYPGRNFAAAAITIAGDPTSVVAAPTAAAADPISAPSVIAGGGEHSRRGQAAEAPPSFTGGFGNPGARTAEATSSVSSAEPQPAEHVAPASSVQPIGYASVDPPRPNWSGSSGRGTSAGAVYTAPQPAIRSTYTAPAQPAPQGSFGAVSPGPAAGAGRAPAAGMSNSSAVRQGSPQGLNPLPAGGPAAVVRPQGVSVNPAAGGGGAGHAPHR